MKQMTLGGTGFEKYGKTTRRARFLAEMDRVVPWAELCALIEPVYPKAGPDGGRPTVPLERMLRIYFLQQWFDLSDPGVEEALHDSLAMRSFAGIDLSQERVPDESTALNFRHLLERHQLGKPLLAAVNNYLRRQGIKVTHGTIVDATIITAPTSTKNRRQERDPEMHQTQKGQQWYFGMKAHLGVDSSEKLVHTVLASAANVADKQALPYLLHGKETRVWGDAAYQGQTQVIHECAPHAKDFTNRRCRHRGRIDVAEQARNRTKSRVRAKVEHVIGVLKRVFGFCKVRYRGLAKNLHRLEVTCALANLFIVRRRLLRI
jgi:IS5 family transposase